MIKKAIIIFLTISFIGAASAFNVNQTGEISSISPQQTEEGAYTNVANYSVTDINQSDVDVITGGFQGDLSVNQEQTTNNSTMDVEVFARMSVNNEAGNYTGSIDFTNGTKTIERSFDIELLELESLEANPNRINLTAETGSTGTLETINISNTGNTQLDVTVSVNNTESTGDIKKIVDMNRRILIQPQTDRQILSTYSVASGQEPGNYSGEVILEAKNTNLSKTIGINTEIVDRKDPSVNLSVGDTNSTLPAEIVAETSDNVGVKDVEAEIFKEKEKEVQENNETITETVNQSISNITLEPSGDGEYVGDFEETRDLGNYHVVVNVTDTSGNNDVDRDSFEVNKLQLFNIPNPNIDSDTAQIETWSTTDAFSLSYDRDVEVTLEDFTYGVSDNNSMNDVTVQIILPNGGNDFFSSPGDTITVSEAGQYRIRVKGNKTEVYNARFSFSDEEYYESPDNIVITGNFREVATPDGISREWAGADWMKCSNTAEVTMFGETFSYSQTNNIDEARYVCAVPFKLTKISGEIEDNAVPIPPEVYDKMNSQQDQRVNSLQSENWNLTIKNWIKNLLLFGTWFGFPVYIIFKQRGSIKLI